MARALIVLLSLLVGLTVPGLSLAGADEAVLREDDEGVVLATVDDDGDDTGNTNTGNTNTGNTNGDSMDTTAERSRSRDRSGDKTGGGQGADRSRSRDASADNTNDHSIGVTTNT
jgi:hypothetical protein